jgi:predicted phage replisome organizer
MADVKWIKIYTDMVSNKKIKRIRKLPEGNNIVLIWVFLLAQAGECNKNGALYLTDTLTFRAEDLAIEFDYDVTVINLALITLERFSMIEVFDEIIYIKNWNEYQNIEGMDKIREQTRLRNIKYRENQKLLQQLNDVSVTSHDATELELDLELEKEKKKKNKELKEYPADTVELTNHLIDLMLLNNPNVKIPTSLDKWNDEMDKLERLDKYDYMQIRSVIDWCQQDPFWKGNILSAPKLREKIATLLMQMQRPKAGTNGKLTGFAKLQQMSREAEQREASGHY